MRRVLLATATLLLGAHACLAQISTMGTTAMGLPSTPAAIQSSPLNGPSPFSATTGFMTLRTLYGDMVRSSSCLALGFQIRRRSGH